MSAKSTFFTFDAVNAVRQMLTELISEQEEAGEKNQQSFEFNMSNVTIDFARREVTIEGVISAYGTGPDVMTLNDFVAALKTEPMYPEGWVEVSKAKK
ncbi:MAG: hypothetical protein ACOY3E_10740 [Pseudomonadota bacterium]